jgi:hypothetical protein
MELRRSRSGLIFGGVLAMGGLFLLAVFQLQGLLVIVATLAYFMAAVAAIRQALRPFRFVIGPAGLTVRWKELDRLVPWEEIEAIVLDRPAPTRRRPAPSHYLLLVPTATSPLAARAAERPAPGGPAGIELLDLASVKDKPADIAAALERYSGGRLVTG